MPCNFNQRALAQKVKQGIREAGGTPMEFNTISVSDGVTMGVEGMRGSLGAVCHDRRVALGEIGRAVVRVLGHAAILGGSRRRASYQPGLATPGGARRLGLRLVGAGGAARAFTFTRLPLTILYFGFGFLSGQSFFGLGFFTAAGALAAGGGAGAAGAAGLCGCLRGRAAAGDAERTTIAVVRRGYGDERSARAGGDGAARLYTRSCRSHAPRGRHPVRDRKPCPGRRAGSRRRPRRRPLPAHLRADPCGRRRRHRPRSRVTRPTRLPRRARRCAAAPRPRCSSRIPPDPP